MNYIELSIPADSEERAEIIMALLSDFPFESFETGPDGLKAYIRRDELDGCHIAVEDFIASEGLAGVFTEIEAVNWNEVWESNFEPVDIEGRCMIRAPFHDAPPEGVLDIVIMPKMSFGTGHHATTWLVASEIMRRDFTGLAGLDMGSGTGVLAIIAARRGATHVDAVDIDEWCFENGGENIAVNGVAEQVTPMLGDISAVTGRDYDFILANINRNILLADMDKYASALRQGGLLVMSGILEKDIPVIDEKAKGLGLIPDNAAARDGWAALTYAKK